MKKAHRIKLLQGALNEARQNKWPDDFAYKMIGMCHGKNCYRLNQHLYCDRCYDTIMKKPGRRGRMRAIRGLP